jgi:hypothetical protein
MAVLTERQKKAQRLADELGRCPGCWVTSPMPLDDGARGLRVQVLNETRDDVISELCQSGWLPILAGDFPRFTSKGLVAASLFEIPIERERPSVPAEGPKMPGEAAALAERQAKKAMAAEIAQFRKSAGLDK